MKNLFREIIYTPISLAKGLWITFINLFRKKVTLQYPEVRWELPENYRGLPALPVGELSGKDKCIGCGACARMCPQNAIKVFTETGEDKKRRLTGFELDAGVCIWCGLCTEVCPTKAIVMSKVYELASFSRTDMRYQLDKLHEFGGKFEETPELDENKTVAGNGGSDNAGAA